MFKRVVVDRFYKYLIPMFLTAFALQLSDFMDSLVVSNLLNSDALAVLNMGGAFNSVISALFSLFGIGGSICYAKYQGLADKATARKYYSTAIFCAIITSLTVVLACNMYPDVLSNMLCKSAELRPMFDSYINYQIVAAPFMCVIMTAVSFLPAAGHPIESMIFNIGFNVSNILLDIVFVKYCHMGVSGAAFATAVSLILWAIGLSLWLWFKKTQLGFKIKGAFDLKVILEIISFGFAIALSQVGFSIKIAYSNAMLNELFGKQGIVTFSVCMQIISIMSVFLSGMLRTVTPLVSMLNGQRDYVGVRQTIRRGMIILGVTSFVVLSLINCFPGMVLRAYNAYNPATLEIAITEIRIFTIALLFRSLYMLYMSYVNAMGRKKYSLFISMFDGFVGILLFARPMVALMGPFGFWWAYPVVSIALCIFMAIINIAITVVNKGELEPFFLTRRNENEVFRFTYDRHDINSLAKASEDAMDFVREKGFSGKTCTAVGLLMEESPRYIMNRSTHTKLMDAIVTCPDNTVEIGYRFVGKPYNEGWFADGKDEANERILERYIKDFDFSYVMGINNIRVIVADEDRKKLKRVLVVDGASSGRELALSLIKNGHDVYHMTSGTEEKYNIDEEHRTKYLRGMTDGVDYIKCFNYDTSKTIEENASVLRPYSFNAVIPGTESGVYTAEKICQALGLKGNNPETSCCRRDKYYMQKALKEAGIRSIDMKLTPSCDEALEFYRKQRNGKMIIKPCSSAGSEMVFLCNDENDVIEYFRENLGKKDFYGNVNEELLIQEYIEGTEYVANSASRNGKHLLTDAYVYRKFNSGGEDGFFLYDRMELLHDIDDYPIDYINAALDAVGIEFGVSHMEFKIDDRGPVMIEVAARPMGESCTVYQNEALGYDITELILDTYSSDEDYEKWYQKLYNNYKPAKYFITKIVTSVLEGKLKDIPAYKNIAELKTVKKVNLIKALRRMEVSVSNSEITSPGEVYLLGDTWEDVNNDAETIYDWERNHPEKLFTLKEE